MYGSDQDSVSFIKRAFYFNCKLIQYCADVFAQAVVNKESIQNGSVDDLFYSFNTIQSMNKRQI